MCYLDILINTSLPYISTLESLSLVADLVHVEPGSYSLVTLIVLNQKLLSETLYIHVIYVIQTVPYKVIQCFSRLLMYNRKIS